MTTTAPSTAVPSVLTLDALLTHWQGHRALTRRVIEAFPEDTLFTFTAAPPMRTFGELSWELVGLTDYVLTGLRDDDWRWTAPAEPGPQDRAALLAAWDAQTPALDTALPGADPEWMNRPQPTTWGEMSPLALVTYAIDNEIHHRGQGYVYLRALGIEPPAFYER
ncbi:DinB family protein [Deinococcus aquaedulcis]|uniref:DinB family protein n=1 Tax=Deinococcus aquaedulcis TaxID=2840455 RepID=UPI001C8290D6|nr:DinB family protein [Deinococcus aquaedulcis]